MILDADNIVLFYQGRIAELGVRDALVRTDDGNYLRLYLLQNLAHSDFKLKQRMHRSKRTIAFISRSEKMLTD